MKGDQGIGRGSKQRNLTKIRYCNDFEVAAHGRDMAMRKLPEKLYADSGTLADVWTLSLLLPASHCTACRSSHGDILTKEFQRQFPGAFDRISESSVPHSELYGVIERRARTG